jgi:hypothetical protein
MQEEEGEVDGRPELRTRRSQQYARIANDAGSLRLALYKKVALNATSVSQLLARTKWRLSCQMEENVRPQ